MTRKQIRKLTTKEVFLVTEKVRNEYVASLMTDSDFAAKCEKELSISGVNNDHVQHIREAWGIASNRGARIEKRQKETLASLSKRVDELERRFEFHLGGA